MGTTVKARAPKSGESKSKMGSLLKKLPFGKKKRKAPLSAAELRQKLFLDLPVWKSLLILTWPAIFQLFLIGSFTFVDSVFAVQFASDSYTPLYLLEKSGSIKVFPPAEQVRTYVSAVSPVASFLNAVSILFSVGIATRISSNIGSGNFDRAKAALKTGNMFSMLVSLILVPVMIFTASSWVASQYPGYDAKSLARIQFNSFSYIAIGIGSYPLQAFWQVVSGIFAVDGRNKVVLLITILPIPVNLFFDWLFMGPLGMAIDGGGWATFIANGSACVFTIIFLFVYKSDILSFKNLFSLKIKWLVVLGIVLAGLEPFLRNLAGSLTTTPELETAQQVSMTLYGNVDTLGQSAPAAFSIFGVMFPLIFAFTQALRPITAFNFGAKQYDRVKQIFRFTIIYSTIFSVIIYMVTSYAIQDALMDMLAVDAQYRPVVIKIVRVILICMPLYSVAIGAMLIFGSTERLMYSLIGAVLRGFLFLFPLMYLFQTFITGGTDEAFYWYFYPIMTGLTSFVLFFLVRKNLRELEKPVVTLDETIDNFEVWAKNRTVKNPFLPAFWKGAFKPVPVAANAKVAPSIQAVAYAGNTNINPVNPVVAAAAFVASPPKGFEPAKKGESKEIELMEITALTEQNKTKTRAKKLTKTVEQKVEIAAPDKALTKENSKKNAKTDKTPTKIDE